MPMAQPVGDEKEAHRHQAGDLDDVDEDGRHCGAADASEGDISADQGQRDAADGLRYIRERVMEDGLIEVPEKDAHEADHDGGVQPVVQVADPPDGELGGPGELPHPRALPVKQCRFGEVVARPRPGVGIDPGQLAVAVRGQEGQDEREEKPGPHV